MSGSKTNSGGIGFLGLLTILFIGLKLTGHIAWSWWWVLSPIWIVPAIVLGFFAVVFLGAVCVAVKNKINFKQRRGSK